MFWRQPYWWWDSWQRPTTPEELKSTAVNQPHEKAPTDAPKRDESARIILLTRKAA